MYVFFANVVQCEEVAKIREYESVRQEPKTRHRKQPQTGRRFFLSFFFFAHQCKKKRKDEI